MSNILDAEMRMLGETVERYVAAQKDLAGTAGNRWQEFAELGWLSLPYPEEAGGLGFGSAGVAAIMKGHGNGLMETPFLPFTVMAGGVMARCPDAAETLTTMMSGDMRVAPGFPGAGCDDVAGVRKFVASAAPGGYSLSGGEIRVLAVEDADAVLVPASLENSSELALFLVPLEAPGLSSRAHRLPDGRAAGYVSMKNVIVSSTARLDGDIDVLTVLGEVMDEALIAAAAENVGAMQALFDLTLEYAKLRRQFGRAIGSFQSLQFRLVDMWIKLDEASSLVAAAAAARDRQEIASLAAAAWIQSIWSGRLIGEEAIQIHGAIAMTDEYVVGRYVKRLLVNELLFGAPERYLDRYRSCQAN